MMGFETSCGQMKTDVFFHIRLSQNEPSSSAIDELAGFDNDFPHFYIGFDVFVSDVQAIL